MLRGPRGQLSCPLQVLLLLVPREAGEATTLLSGLFVYNRPIRVGRRVPTGRGWGPLVHSSQPVQEGPPALRRAFVLPVAPGPIAKAPPDQDRGRAGFLERWFLGSPVSGTLRSRKNSVDQRA